jgi:DNA repair exonuclease SbcCD ATPase subunit
MKDTFTENLADMTAQENLAIKYFTGYKERTEAQIAAETKLIAEKQAAVQANSQEIAVTVEALETSRTTLAEKKEQLRVQSEHLAKHTKFHDETKQETLALLESVQNAIELLSSPEALKTMSKSEEHMTAVPSFMQTQAFPSRKFALLASKNIRKAEKAANAYAGWGSIYKAIDEMTDALNAQLAEDDEMFANCEDEVKTHLANERDLKAKYTEDRALKASTEAAIETAKNTIKTCEETIATAQDTIRDTMEDLNKLIQDTDREVAEGKAATKLFNEAIAMLSTNTGKEMGSGPEDQDDTTADADYDTSKIKEGTSRVTAIIEKVRDDMNKEIQTMVKENEETMQEYRDLVDEKKEEIEKAEGDLGKAQQTLADSKTTLAGAEQRLKYTNEGLAAELKWWGDANSGTNLDTRGQECIKWLGREEFGGHGDRTGGDGSASGFTATDKVDGDGLYHSKTSAKNNEKDELASLKSLIEGLEQQYKVPQPVF